MGLKWHEAEEIEGQVRRAVRALRTLQQLTQQELADRMIHAGAPMSGNTVSQLESGKRGFSVKELVAVADALGITAAQLLDGSAFRESHLRRAAALRSEAERIEREAERLT